MRDRPAIENDAPQPRPADAAARPALITRRAVVLSLALVVLVAYGGFYAGLVYGSSTGASEFAAGVPPMAPLVLLLLLTALNPLAPRLGLRGLSRRELLTIYAIVSVSGPVVSHGILPWMLGHDLAPRYVARVTPEWETTFLGYLPEWFSTSNAAAAEGFFLGAARVPWRAWLAPMLAWGSFLIALFLCTLSLMVLFAHQWIVNERLAFPLAQVPLQTVREEATGRGPIGRLPGRSLFWLGVIIPVVLASGNVLSNFFPAIPALHYSVRDEKIIWLAPTSGPFTALGDFTSVFDPWVIAMAFLLPKEVSFSCWFFRFVRVGLTMLAISFGANPAEAGSYGSTFPAPYQQGGGATIALVGLVIWTGRRHLAHAARLALGLGAGGQRPRDVALYRWALLIFLTSFAYLSYFCHLAGARPLLAVAIVGSILILYVAWARLRVETGLSFLAFSLGTEDMITEPLGSAFLRPQEVVTLIGTRWAYFPGGCSSSEALTANSIEALKVTDAAALAPKPVVTAVVAGFFVALVLGVYLVLSGAYHYGMDNMHVSAFGWLHSQYRFVGGRMYDMIVNPVGPDVNGIIAMGAGAAVTILLGALRLRFWWWPLHPLGYLAANGWGMHWYWLPFLIGWVWKTLTLRYGGLKLYRQLMPLAIGAIMGDMVGRAIWQAGNILLGRMG
jgi:hypothetical protein